MKIFEIIKRYENRKSYGLQLSKNRGILSSTWALYFKNELFYYFDINENFTFDEAHKYTKKMLCEYFKNDEFEIEFEIS